MRTAGQVELEFHLSYESPQLMRNCEIHMLHVPMQCKAKATLINMASKPLRYDSSSSCDNLDKW